LYLADFDLADRCPDQFLFDRLRHADGLDRDIDPEGNGHGHHLCDRIAGGVVDGDICAEFLGLLEPRVSEVDRDDLSR